MQRVYKNKIIIFLFLIGFLFLFNNCKKNKPKKVVLNNINKESNRIKLLKNINKLEQKEFVDDSDIDIVVQYIKERNYLNAVKWLKKIEKKNPNNFEIIYYLGVSHQLLNKKRIALDYYKRGLELSENNEKILFNIGKIYYLQHNFKKALKYFSKGLLYCVDEFDKIEVYWYLASIYYKQNENEKALKFYKRFYSLANMDNKDLYYEKIKDSIGKMRKIIKAIKFKNSVKKKYNNSKYF